MYSPFKMKGKSPMMKALIGKQNNLPEQLKAKILAAPDSPAKMKKATPAKMAKKSPTKKINPFSAEYKRMTVNQRKKKYGDDYKTKIKGGGKKDLTVANIKESLGNLNKKIKTGADKVSNVISPKDASGKPQKKTITTKGGRIKVKNKTNTTSVTSTPVVVNPPAAKGKVTYKQAWDKMSAKKKEKYADFAEFKKAAEDYNKKKKK